MFFQELGEFLFDGESILNILGIALFVVLAVTGFRLFGKGSDSDSSSSSAQSGNSSSDKKEK